MEEIKFSFRDLLEQQKTKRRYQLPEFTQELESFERGTGGKGPYVTGTYVPLHARVVDSTTNVNGASLIERMRAHSLAYRLGVRSIGGLSSNVYMATETLMGDTQFVSEVGTINPVTDPTFTGDRIVPMRLYTTIPVSDMLNKLNGPAFDDYLADLVMRSQADALDRALITGDGVTAPLGILNDPAVQVDNLAPDGLALTLDNVLESEDFACKNGYDSESLEYAYLMNAETRKALKQTSKVAGGENMIMAGNNLNGYNAAVSNHVPNNIALGLGVNLSAMIFGNFHDIMILNWGGMDILTDNITSARNAITWIHCSTFLNIKILKPENFHVLNGIVT